MNKSISPPSSDGLEHQSDPRAKMHASNREPIRGIEEAGALRLVADILRFWKFFLVFPPAVAVIVAIISLLLPSKYTAAARFSPEQQQSGLQLPASVAALASQFSVGGSFATANSPSFYIQILESRTLRDTILGAMFADPRTAIPNDSASLLDILEIEGENPTERLEKGRYFLSAAVDITLDRESGIVEVEATSGFPALSADLSNRFMEMLNRFNLNTRQSNTRLLRIFVEERVRDAESQLRGSETRLEQFLQDNRPPLTNSPTLAVRYERLQRDVAMNAEVFTTLRRKYEEARISEVNDTPVITIIDFAVEPDERSSPRRKTLVLLASVAGVFVAFLIALGQSYVRDARVSNPAAFQQLAERWREIKKETVSLLFRGSRRTAG